MKPVAYGMRREDGQIFDCISPAEQSRYPGEYTVPLYAAPPAQPAPAVPDMSCPECRSDAVVWECVACCATNYPPAAPAVPDGVPDTSLVICPNCCTQFRAIPQDVQRLMIDAGFEPPFVAAPVVREQLTNGEIYTAYIAATNQTLRPQDERLALAFARAIEQAHGIAAPGSAHG